MTTLTPSLGTYGKRSPLFYRRASVTGRKNGGVMGPRAKTRRLFAFVLWAQQQDGLPEAAAIMAQFQVSRPVAYRWRELYADLTDQPIPCMGTGRRARG